METRTFLRKWWLAGIGVITLGMVFPYPVFEYEISAHAALTAAIIETHNRAHPENAIADEFRFDLIRGSKEEDAQGRSVYHFYDPISGKGLTAQGVSWLSAKVWAHDEEGQSAFARKFFIAEIGRASCRERV